MGIIFGRNPVIELLKTDNDIEKIYLTTAEGSSKVIIGKAKEQGIIVEVVNKQKLDKLTENAVHQGVVAVAPEVAYSTVEDILAVSKAKGEPPFILMLDGICDPHNLGAIIRTANGAGVHGIIIPKRGSVGLNSTVAKTSAGAINYTKVARVSNLAQTMETLKQQGIWFYATHQDAKVAYNKVDYSGGVGLIIGSEGEGVSQLLLKKCDVLISIPMLGEINSLNASVASGIVMYQVVDGRLV